MKKFLSITTLALVATFAFTSCQSTGSGDQFSKADKNKDGKLTSQEASDYIVIGVFEALDVNKDGKLSLSECAVAAAPSTTKDFQKRDRNKDGFVTRQEALAYGRKFGVVKQVFIVVDKNRDGLLSREEIAAYYASKQSRPH